MDVFSQVSVLLSSRSSKPFFNMLLERTPKPQPEEPRS
jgi:hypothetical protein